MFKCSAHFNPQLIPIWRGWVPFLHCVVETARNFARQDHCSFISDEVVLYVCLFCGLCVRSVIILATLRVFGSGFYVECLCLKFFIITPQPFISSVVVCTQGHGGIRFIAAPVVSCGWPAWRLLYSAYPNYPGRASVVAQGWTLTSQWLYEYTLKLDRSSLMSDASRARSCVGLAVLCCQVALTTHRWEIANRLIFPKLCSQCSH